MHGLPSPLEYLGETRLLLARELTISRLYCLPDNYIL